MPPPRRPRDRVARALRATADRLSAPDSPDAPSSTGFPDSPSSPSSPGSPGSPADVPRPSGQPPEHWRRLVAAHAPGLLRDLPPPPSPVEHGPLTGPSANGSPDRTPVRREETSRRGMGRLWRGWKARLADRFGTTRSRTRHPHGADPGSSSRSWDEPAPTGAISYQDLQGVPMGGTGAPESAEPGAAANRAAAGPTRAASTWTGPGSGSARPGSGPAGAESGTGRAGARSGSAGAASSAPAATAGFHTRYDAGPGAASAPALPPVCRCGTGSRGPAGSPGERTTARDADATGSAGTPGRARTPGAAGGSGTTGSTNAAGSANGAGSANAAGSAGTAGTTGGTDTAGSRAADTAGSFGTPASGGPDRQSPPTRWPGVDADRADALARRARAGRSRERHRPDASGTEPSPAREDVLPLPFAAASPHRRQGPAGHGGTGDGPVDHHPGRAAGSPYPDGRDPAPGGEFRTRRWQGPTSGSPWPALPDDGGSTRTPSPAGAGRASDGRAHADPWPALPGEPVWWTPAARATPWDDTARLDREQAGD